MSGFLIGSAVTAYLAKDGLNKLLGPTAEYLGDGLLDFTKKRVENISNVFRSAEAKLGDRINKPGRVPPKVLREIVNEASYSEDPLATEYFGGVLASSRSEIGRDDRGAGFARLISELSSYQLRAHYIIYNSVAHLFNNRGLSLLGADGRSKMKIFISFQSFVETMEFSSEEGAQFNSILRHILFGLHSHGLIENHRFGGDVKFFKGANEIAGAGILIQPSAIGADLLLWAHALGELPLDHIVSAEFETLIDKEIISAAAAIPAARTH
jgi:hypothetical protein